MDLGNPLLPGWRSHLARQSRFLHSATVVLFFEIYKTWCVFLADIRTFAFKTMSFIVSSVTEVFCLAGLCVKRLQVCSKTENAEGASDLTCLRNLMTNYKGGSFAGRWSLDLPHALASGDCKLTVQNAVSSCWKVCPGCLIRFPGPELGGNIAIGID